MIKKIYLIPLIFALSNIAKANDIPVGSLFTPIIDINPSEYNGTTPKDIHVKLLINTNGLIEHIYYPENMPTELIKRVDSTVKTARFTPYYRDGQAVKSIVPFTIKFQLTDNSEEETPQDQ
ncbi:hypothetical protein [Acinetobacter sp. P1(2025)]|uniref:hypothetical protein n=1 Tax=Acinetobacter sp. P1(2025) TaxID=3446120 RepID=UPI003F52FD0C